MLIGAGGAMEFLYATLVRSCGATTCNELFLCSLSVPNRKTEAQERNQNVARTQLERSQDATRPRPERSKNAARAQPERSYNAARKQAEL